MKKEATCLHKMTLTAILTGLQRLFSKKNRLRRLKKEAIDKLRLILSDILTGLQGSVKPVMVEEIYSKLYSPKKSPPKQLPI